MQLDGIKKQSSQNCQLLQNESVHSIFITNIPKPKK